MVLNEKEFRVLTFLGKTPWNYIRPTVIALRTYSEKGTRWGYECGI